MFHGNRESFALKRELIRETKQKLLKLPLQSRSNNSKSTEGLIFIYEWLDDDDSIIGYGCNMDGEACRISPKIEPGLFVVSAELLILQEFVALNGYRMQVFEEIFYKANNFALTDLFVDPTIPFRPAYLVKIITSSVADAQRLHYKLKNDVYSYRFASVAHYFDVTKQIMFELLTRNVYRQLADGVDRACIDFKLPQTTLQWMDDLLNVYKNFPDPELPIITFDIETVSSDPHRVPTGDAPCDILYSVSVHHIEPRNNVNHLYSLVYLPLNLPKKNLTKMIADDGYEIVPDKKVDDSKCVNVLECFNNERDLLVRTMELMTWGKKLHYLIGYNSINYDIKYLLTRCAFYRVMMDKFIWRDGFCFGIEQMHLDLFRIIVMRYRFKSYTLNEVSGKILNDSKTGVSAVNLRFSFFRMYKHKRFFRHDEGSEKMPSVRDTLHYNNADTLLVSKLVRRTQSIEFILGIAQECQVPVTTLNTNYNKMQFKLWNRCLIVGLNLKYFFGQCKKEQVSLVIPMNTEYNYPNKIDLIDVNIDMTAKLNVTDRNVKNVSSNGSDEHEEYFNSRYLQKEKKAKFPGGANFCLGEYDVKDVQMYDYVTAYPLLMDRKNISDETLAILPANMLDAIYDTIANVGEYKTYDYLAHHGSTKTETIILYYQYIYDDMYCGGEFEFCRAELQKRQSAPIIIIWTGRRGVLSAIVAEFNKVRAETKVKRECLKNAESYVAERIERITSEQQMLKALQQKTAAAPAITINNTCDEIEDDDDFFDVIETKKAKIADEDADNFDFDIFDDEESTEQAATDDNFDFDIFDEEATEPVAEKENDFDFDIFNDEDDEDSPKNENTVAVVEKSKPEIKNHFNFKFVNKFITIFENHVCYIDEEELAKVENPTEILSEIAENISLELNCVSNSYDLQKSTVSSIYGCVGKIIPVVAAGITCITRNTLLASAQHCRKLGNEILYIDTDSIMMIGPNSIDLSPELNNMYPDMVMEMKVASKCMFVKRKTYYKVEDGTLKYGQNINGPIAWRECIEYFAKRTEITTNDDIYTAFYEFFMSVYKRLTTYTTVTPEFLSHFTQTIKTKSDYKTLTVAAKFKMYLMDNYPAIAGANKHSIYYNLENTVLMPCLRPDFDIKSVDDLRNVNLFKYYQNIFTTVFNLIKFHIRKNNEPFHITMPNKFVLLLMLKGFMNAYEQTFPNTLQSNEMPLQSVPDEDLYIDHEIFNNQHLNINDDDEF